jgi:hypothetical protein
VQLLLLLLMLLQQTRGVNSLIGLLQLLLGGAAVGFGVYSILIESSPESATAELFVAAGSSAAMLLLCFTKMKVSHLCYVHTASSVHQCALALACTSNRQVVSAQYAQPLSLLRVVLSIVLVARLITAPTAVER